MRQFNLREDVSSEASRDSGGKRTPQSGIYVPNYQGVNQILYKVGGDGAIAFNDALAAESRKKMAEYQAVYDGLEMGNHLTGFNGEMIKGARDLKMNNPSGQGYTDNVTSLHDQLSQKYMQMASNEEVRNKLQLTFIRSKGEWANAAFRDQVAMTKGYAANQNEIHTEKLKNQLIANPDSFLSLSEQYESVVETMRPVLSALEYEKYRTQKAQEWIYSHGIGLINRNPTQAENLLHGEEFMQGLPSNKYIQLQHHARQEKDYRLARQKMIESDRKQIFNRRAAVAVSNIEYAIELETGNAVDMIQSAFANGQISVIQKNKLEIDLHKHEEQRKNKNRAHEEIDRSLAEGFPAPEISAHAKSSYFYEWVKGVNEERKGRGEDSLSFTEQVEFLKRNSLTFNSNIPSLKSSLAEIIRTPDANTDGKQLMDACIAVVDNENVPAIQGIDQDVVDFARLAVDTYKTRGSIDQVKKNAAVYFAPIDKNTREMRNKTWKEENYSDKNVEKFLKRNGFATEEGKFWNSIPGIVKQSLIDEAYSTIKRVYHRTGSLSVAESIAAQMFQSRYGVTEINGEKQPMIDPPEKASPVSEFVVHNVVSKLGQDLVRRIEKAGDKYLGIVPIRLVRSGDGDNLFIPIEKDTAKYFEKPLTSSKGRTVEVLINGEWEKRNLNIAPVGGRSGIYVYYILVDPNNSYSRIEILDPQDNTPAMVDLSGEGIANFRKK